MTTKKLLVNCNNWTNKLAAEGKQFPTIEGAFEAGMILAETSKAEEISRQRQELVEAYANVLHEYDCTERAEAELDVMRGELQAAEDGSGIVNIQKQHESQLSAVEAERDRLRAVIEMIQEALASKELDDFQKAEQYTFQFPSVMCLDVLHEYDASDELVQLHVCNQMRVECNGNHQCCCGKEWNTEGEPHA